MIGRRTLIVAVVVVGVAATLIELSSRGSSASQSAGLFSCTTSTDHGACVFPQDTADFPGINPGSGRPASQGIEVDQNEWSGGTGSCSGSTQTLSANSAENYHGRGELSGRQHRRVHLPERVAPRRTGGGRQLLADHEQLLRVVPAQQRRRRACGPCSTCGSTTGQNEVMIQYDFSRQRPVHRRRLSPTRSRSAAKPAACPSQPWFLCTFGSPMANGSYRTTAWKLGPNEAGKESESSGSIRHARHDQVPGRNRLPARQQYLDGNQHGLGDCLDRRHE